MGECSMDNKTLPHTPFGVTEKDGTIYLDDERIVLTSSAVFGTLRKDLGENIGFERMKGFLIRYGWNLGANDAKRAMKKDFSSVEELLKQGTIFHAIKGYTKAKTTNFKLNIGPNQTVESVHVEGIWFSSYEAEENITLFGINQMPVCHTLVGYASGYYSTICKQPVIFKEIACKGMGDKECHYIGKSLHTWKEEIAEEYSYYENKPIVKELELTYEMLLEERNNLAKTSVIHEKLTEEIINGNDLHSVAAAVYEITGIPLIIEDINFQEFTYAGITHEDFQKVDNDFKTYIQLKQVALPFTETQKLEADHHQRLITPIHLQKKVFGYCSFIYSNEVQGFPKINVMILERVAAVCSIYLLNEKTSFEALERMKGHFLEQVLSEQLSAKKEILKRGSYINMDLNKPYHIVILKYRNKQNNLVNELFLHEQIMETIFQYFKNQKPNLLIGQYEGNITLLVQSESLKQNDTISKLCTRLIEHLFTSYPECLFQAGISTKSHQIQQASNYYKEATIALKIGNYHEKVLMFDDLGVTGILISSQNKEAVKQKAHYLLGPLFENKGTKNTELLKTLYVFLLNGGNLEKTMKDLSISMSGLRYRIEKIETLLTKDLRDPQVSYELLLTLKALIVAGDITLND
jgi:sugar diacid utilization regulator